MTAMNDIITDAMLNQIDKLLVLNHGHGLTVQRIKQLTTAKKVKKLQPRKNEFDAFVCNVMWQTNRHVHNSIRSIDVYFIAGDAKSIMLSMMDCLVTAIAPSAKQMKQMHNAVTCIMFVDRFRALISSALDTHQDLNSGFKRNRAVTNKIYRWSSALQKMDAGYGDSERKQLLALLAKEFKSTW